MKIGYARVSTREQYMDMQVIALEEAGCQKIYEEKVSGVKADRPILNNLINHSNDKSNNRIGLFKQTLRFFI
jgi:DNA invertase Pin-like site-specific DNA recombinase